MRYVKRRLSSVRQLYDRMEATAERQGVKWLFNLDTWSAAWHLKRHLRGSKPTDLRMVRIDETGDWEPDNVKLVTNRSQLQRDISSLVKTRLQGNS